MRKELDGLSKESMRLREQTSELTARVEQSMKEYGAMTEKLGGDKTGSNEQNRQKEANIRKLHAELAAVEAEAKEAEREAKEYADEVGMLCFLI